MAMSRSSRSSASSRRSALLAEARALAAETKTRAQMAESTWKMKLLALQAERNEEAAVADARVRAIEESWNDGHSLDLFACTGLNDTSSMTSKEKVDIFLEHQHVDTKQMVEEDVSKTFPITPVSAVSVSVSSCNPSLTVPNPSTSASVTTSNYTSTTAVSMMSNRFDPVMSNASQRLGSSSFVTTSQTRPITTSHVAFPGLANPTSVSAAQHDHEHNPSAARIRQGYEQYCNRSAQQVQDHYHRPLTGHDHFPRNTFETDARAYFSFLAKRDLVARDCPKFDDNPLHFRSWKVSFCNIIKEVELDSSEILSELVKYLKEGSESRALVERLANVYINDPERGLSKAWERLTERFGSDEAISQALMSQIYNFEKIENDDSVGLRAFGDQLEVIEGAKSNSALHGLAALDTPMLMNTMVDKLPSKVQEKWRSLAFNFKESRGSYPTFDRFVEFVQRQANMRNDPSLYTPQFQALDPLAVFYTKINPPKPKSDTKQGSAASSDKPKFNEPPSTMCPIHKDHHPLARCFTFQRMKIGDKLEYLAKNKICSKCLGTYKHTQAQCDEHIVCKTCQATDHLSMMHTGMVPPKPNAQRGSKQPDKAENAGSNENVVLGSACTAVCGDSRKHSTSCSKIFLTQVSHEEGDKPVLAYAIVDEQSNCTLATSELLNEFEKFQNAPKFGFQLRTCSGTTQTSGRRISGLRVKALVSDSAERRYALPTVVEVKSIPSNTSEIADPDKLQAHAHLRPILPFIPARNPDVKVTLLIGRDAPELLKVLESVNGPVNAPWAQRLALGWTVMGNVCLNGYHAPATVDVRVTHTLPNGRHTICEPCPNVVKVDELLTDTDNIFEVTKDDNKLGMSQEDRKFLHFMDSSMEQTEAKNWQSPLPLRDEESMSLPCNRPMAKKRLSHLLSQLERNPEKKRDYFEFMGNILKLGHAELAPPTPGRYYLCHFGVYHPRKHKIRVVMDSSSKFKKKSLNDVLLSGPNLVSNLVGVLIRFRLEQVAFSADIEQMFHSFLVDPGHRDYLRFFWFKDNDPTNEIVEYQMRVHVFGNSPSPAVAIYGLRKTAEIFSPQYGSDCLQFVIENFYVDDGLKSLPDEASAIDLLKRTRSMLAEANLHLHKIASNKPAVMDAFPESELATGLAGIDLSRTEAPVQGALGVTWNLNNDAFQFHISDKSKDFTKRGVLSVINGLYDPLGFAAPIIIRGKNLLRTMMSSSLHEVGWDDPLPSDMQSSWENWLKLLHDLENVSMPRAYSPSSTANATRRELHTFSDASSDAIAAVSYLRLHQPNGEVTVSFVFGKAKLAPKTATTIPRLELCAAVLAVQVYDLACEELSVSVPVESSVFYSDSAIVLNYLRNETRRFYVYVSNRIARILESSLSNDWHHVVSAANPADVATRPIRTDQLADSLWLSGPEFLLADNTTSDQVTTLENVDPVSMDTDPEVRPHVITTNATSVLPRPILDSHRFQNFSTWNSLVNGLAALIRVASHSTSDRVACREKAKLLILRSVQAEAFPRALKDIDTPEPSMAALNPEMNSDGLLIVGGRLRHAQKVPDVFKNPVILPKGHHVSGLIIHHYHARVFHQGRHITAGAVLDHGFWIVGAKRMISFLCLTCVICRKLRGKFQEQKMSDLPSERVTPSVPFCHVGIDVFGPWKIASRITRANSTESKRWALIFVCLSVRAVHIEVLESMSTSSFINALRRFQSIRGPVNSLWSDRGTNFIGAFNELDNSAVGEYLTENNITWNFNVPHSSHMAGSWERLIGTCRGVLNGIFADPRYSQRLTHESLTTFMAEVCAIVNSRPLVPASTDPDDPRTLSPAQILTMKPQPLDAPVVEFMHVSIKAVWKNVQAMANVFWKKWRGTYLSELQSRSKWRNVKRNIRIGDIVLLRTDESRCNWPVSRITDVMVSSDGLVRKAKLKVPKYDYGSKRIKFSSYERPIHELILLIGNDNEND